MAYRIVTQVLLIGSRAIGRAFAEAYRQHSATTAYAASQKIGSNQTSDGVTRAHAGLTLEEACKILNVAPPKQGEANMEEVMERFKKLFDANEVKNGGSFYLQSKILRARERIEQQVREDKERKEREKELDEGWKPKVYKDR